MGDASSLGFGHFLANADIVAKVLLVVLAFMSAISWYLIIYKASASSCVSGAAEVPDLFWVPPARVGAERAHRARRA